MDETGLYIHIPFCRRKCSYCDFFSVEGSPSDLKEYVSLLVKHLDILARERGGCPPLDTVFFGGGTPSLLAPSDVARILEAVHRLFGLASGAEVSLEANPGTVTLESLKGYRTAGINRLSFGLQSLDRGNLNLLGRIHSSQDAIAAVTRARRAGFTNVSCDLIFGLPGKSSGVLEEDLRGLLDLEPDHLSCYALTFEEGTPLFTALQRGEVDLPSDDDVADEFLYVHDVLEGANYSHYEISNYARPGFECRHNIGYWRRRSCLAIGAGAHSFDPGGWGSRFAVPPDLRRYAASLEGGENPSRLIETFGREDAMAETLYLGLRTARGVPEKEFRLRFGAGVAEAFPRQVAKHGDRLLLVGGGWCFDLKGWLLFDHLIADFL